MKKISSIILTAATAVLLCACSDGNKEAVTNFATDFAGKLKAQQVDSLKAVYPDVEKAAELVPSVDVENMVVDAVSGDSVYSVKYGENASLTVRVSPDGKMSVKDSHGLFAYPKSTVSFAEKVGGLKSVENPTDAQLAEIMATTDALSANLFKDYVESRKNAIKKSGPVITKDIEFMMDEGRGYYTLTNTTDQPIAGKDYTITWLDEYIGFGVEEHNKRIENGKDIPANGSVKVDFMFSGHGGASLSSVAMKVPTQEEFYANFTPTGNEYEAYVKANGTVSASAADDLSEGPYTIAGKLNGKLPIHINLNKGMRDGSYYYDKYGPSNTLTLTVKSFNKKTGTLVIEERNDKGEVTGTFSGTLTPETFVGEMTAYTGKTLPFNLKVVNE
ncbi:MAG: hypothetical protein NC338_07380 [Firmicutes bacterium]|nr:hypothetical protein [Bacillota bacterium]MCM1400980.1 hypothetical protein [Bacteroides sp.]MCM1476503.1 hypothetical protein [Bacteroides sp.]